MHTHGIKGMHMQPYAYKHFTPRIIGENRNDDENNRRKNIQHIGCWIKLVTLEKFMYRWNYVGFLYFRCVCVFFFSLHISSLCFCCSVFCFCLDIECITLWTLCCVLRAHQSETNRRRRGKRKRPRERRIRNELITTTQYLGPIVNAWTRKLGQCTVIYSDE